MPLKRRGKKDAAAEQGSHAAEGAEDSGVGRALALRSQRPKLALAAAIAAATVGLVAALLARRSHSN